MTLNYTMPQARIALRACPHNLGLTGHCCNGKERNHEADVCPSSRSVVPTSKYGLARCRLLSLQTRLPGSRQEGNQQQHYTIEEPPSPRQSPPPEAMAAEPPRRQHGARIGCLVEVGIAAAACIGTRDSRGRE